MPVLVLNTCMDINMHLTINSFRQLYPDKIFSLTFCWLLVKSLTSPWQLSESLTFPGFPEKLSPYVEYSIRGIRVVFATMRYINSHLHLQCDVSSLSALGLSTLFVGHSSCSSSSRMRVMNHNWTATKQCLHPQSVAAISRHSVLSGDRIRQCGTSSGSCHKDTVCKLPFPSAGTAVSLFHANRDTVGIQPLITLSNLQSFLGDPSVQHWTEVITDTKVLKWKPRSCTCSRCYCCQWMQKSKSVRLQQLKDNYQVTLNPQKWPWLWTVTLTC